MDVTKIAALAMQNDLMRLETISQNLANVLTPGYKKQVRVSGSFIDQMAAVMPAGGQQSMPASLSIDPGAGPVRYTAQAGDLAIEGDGFFEMLTPAGPAYTRRGDFHADVNGRLVGVEGFPVMGEGGEIAVTNAPFTIEPNGTVHQGGRIAGHIKVVEFDQPRMLVPTGSGLYEKGGAQFVPGKTATRLRAGFTEGSNVNSAQEMVRLSETVRHFESLQKIMQGYDESLEKTIRKLGEF